MAFAIFVFLGGICYLGSGEKKGTQILCSGKKLKKTTDIIIHGIFRMQVQTPAKLPQSTWNSKSHN